METGLPRRYRRPTRRCGTPRTPWGPGRPRKCGGHLKQRIRHMAHRGHFYRFWAILGVQRAATAGLLFDSADPPPRALLGSGTPFPCYKPRVVPAPPPPVLPPSNGRHGPLRLSVTAGGGATAPPRSALLSPSISLLSLLCSLSSLCSVASQPSAAASVAASLLFPRQPDVQPLVRPAPHHGVADVQCVASLCGAPAR